jgi:pyridinium-3,5-bisthiocarboxylic acid mononucleotide nickel chelatase
MPRVMYFDCFSGAAGDMVLAALLDAGLPLDALRQALGSLGVGHELRVTRVLRAGLTATHVEVLGKDEAAHTHGSGHADAHGDEPGQGAGHHQHDPGAKHDHQHAHDHDPTHHHAPADPARHVHRSLREIAALIDRSALSAAGKARATAMFRRLAEAEAAIHGMRVEQIHLHEVGAIDSIIDIVGIVYGLEWFGIDDIVSSPLNVGGGTIEIAHGTFPVPAPATLRLLDRVPIYSGDIAAELVTPTGALVISTYAKGFGPLPAMTVQAIGYGAGTRDFPKTPNVLRLVIGERVDLPHPGTSEPQNPRTSEPENPGTSEAGADRVLVIECEIDDMSPQLFGPVNAALLRAGAVDAFLTPIYMKKGRPGTLLTVLTPPSLRETVTALLFKETTTLGLRIESVERETLEREWTDVAVDGGRVRIKVARRRGEIVNAAPEFDDCVRVAEATGRPIKFIQAEAMREWALTRK